MSRAGAALAPHLRCWPSALLAAAAAAQTKSRLTREQALADIKSPIWRCAGAPPRGSASWASSPTPPPCSARSRDPDEVVRALAEHSVWQVWSRSGDNGDRRPIPGRRRADEPRRRRRPRSRPSREIIQRKPDFAEAWNKRATLYFLMGEYEKSLQDCDEVMKRNPAHFGALAGYGQIYLQPRPARARARPTSAAPCA